MDLEQVNSEYENAITDLQKAEKQVTYFEQNRDSLLDMHLDNITILRGKAVEAKRNNDAEAQLKFEEEIQKEESTVEYLRNILEKSRENVVNLQNKIDDRYNEIKNNPDLKKHLNEVMEKKYDRRLTKLHEEKEELESRKDRQVNLQDLVAQHPTLMNNLKGIMTAKKQINDLESELSKMTQTKEDGSFVYNDEERAKDIMYNLIPQLQEKLNVNKQNLMDYITRNGINVSEMDVDAVSSKPALDPNGNIDVNVTLNRSIKGTNRQIKGVNKDIRNNEIALNNVRGELNLLQSTPQPVQNVQSEQPQQVSNNQVWENISSSSATPVQSEQTKSEPEEPQPKWYQFIKRFKIWNAKRKQAGLPDTQEKTSNSETVVPNAGAVVQPTTQPTNEQEQVLDALVPHSAEPTPVQQTPQTQALEQEQTERQNFSDSLKYPVVNEIMNEEMQDNMKKAKQQRKEEDRGEL